MIKNYGLDIERERQEQDGTEYLAGQLTCIAEIPILERFYYLPVGEVQKGKEDMMDCAARSPNNNLEMKILYAFVNDIFSPETRRWLLEKGYVVKDERAKFGYRVDLSDAFVAILSGTTKRGNSMKAPLQAIHDHGVIPKWMLPLEKTMTWDQYHDPKRITQEMKDLGKEFLRRIPLFYEQERNVQSDKYILCVGGYAWPVPVNGVYPRVEENPNHAFVKFLAAHKAYDNYRDSFDGDFIKNLAPDYRFIPYGYRLVVNESSVPVEFKPRRNWFLDWLIKLIKKI